MYCVCFLASSLYLSKLQLICQAQQALATFKSFVLSLLLRLMRARDSNLSSICYFVSKFCIASVCICAITPTGVASLLKAIIYLVVALLLRIMRAQDSSLS